MIFNKDIFNDIIYFIDYECVYLRGIVKYIDIINIIVIAGNGGRGYANVKKNKKGYFLSGKRNSSNGGDGGDVWLSVDSRINTLNHFYSCRIFRAGHGQFGRSGGRTGKKGSDVVIKVPWGTKVFIKETNSVLGNMDENQKYLMVARGGVHGVGNGYFRSNCRNINQKIHGLKGECQNLLLELLLVADVGIFGLPNSGKSSFLRAVSSAKPKVANYPFTTLSPYLGVVSINEYDKFVVADVPGIVQGASKGLGLGMRFLKHLERCKMLLHFVDLAPEDNSDLVKNIITIKRELYNYNDILIYKPCWLVFNKIDLLKKYEVNRRIKYVLNELKWTGCYYYISSIYKINTDLLCNGIMRFISC